MSVNVLGKKFELPNALAAMAISCAALIMSVGMGGCETFNKNSYGYNPAKSNRTNFRLPSVVSGGTGKTVGGGGVNTPKVKGVNESAGVNDAAQRKVRDANKEIDRASEQYQKGVGGR